MHFLGEDNVIGSSDDSGTANHHRAEAAVAFIGNDPQEDVEGQFAMRFSNPSTVVEVDYQELGIPNGKLELPCQLSKFLDSEVDDHNFKLLRRHFQLQLWVDHRQVWERVPYDSTMRESLNLHQVGLRLSHYRLKVILNPGQIPTTCGRP